MFLALIERLFVIALLLNAMNVVTGLTTPYLLEIDPEVVSSNLHGPQVVTELLLYGGGALMVLTRWKRVLKAAADAWPLIALVFLALLSAVWSDQPMVTARRAVFLLASTILSVYLGERYSIREFATLLVQAICITIVASIILYAVAPSYYVIDPSHPGAWKGLSSRKNAFGEFMGVGFTLLLLVRFQRVRWSQWLWLALTALMLILSHSATSILTALFIVCMMPLWRIARFEGRQRWPVYIVGAFLLIQIAVVVSERLQSILLVFGRDLTFTGRTKVWAMVITAISHRPLLGYGYDAFWQGLKGESLDILIGTQWLVPTAHNGFLDLWISVGLVGCLTFLYLLIRTVNKCIDYIRIEESAIAFWPISFVCFFLLHNLGESALLTRNALPFLVFATLVTQLELKFKRREPGVSELTGRGSAVPDE